ncbi:alpha/beta hydrolase family protein [Pelistega ratti]|uniref:alpha/beta hydrolase family protein n=1 Tax=Pelistega ratti TaxID=2652177 RepID=UPI00135CEF76|nr:alpha/beta fold hydrolase [Pelistega ratti]
MKLVLMTSALLFCMTQIARADDSIVTHRSLDETKKEVIYRAEKSIYPLLAMNSEDVKQALSNIHSLNRDEWATAFIKEGDKYFQQAEQKKDAQQAAKDYSTAQKLYYFARWPAPLDSTQRAIAYEKERNAAIQASETRGYHIQQINGNYQGQSVPALLGLPKNVKNVPLLLIVGGLDGWKEVRFSQFSSLIDQGVAILTMDMPGTGQSPAKLEKGAETSIISVLEKALENPQIDKSRVVMYGGSFGGYWANVLAANYPDYFTAVVSHSGPFDVTFEKEQFSAVMAGDEYLYDAYPAMFELLRDVKNEQQFFEVFKQQSLKEQGYMTKATTDMLVLGGQKDSMIPTQDLLDVLAMPGGIKEAWINSNGIHMGRDVKAGLLDADINQQVVFPYILRKLNMSAK